MSAVRETHLPRGTVGVQFTSGQGEYEALCVATSDFHRGDVSPCFHLVALPVSMACTVMTVHVITSAAASLADEDGVIRPIAPKHALVHIHQRYIIMEDTDGTE